jgi:hypothetical protein
VVQAIGTSGRHGRFSDLPEQFSRFPDRIARPEGDGMLWIAETMAGMGGRDWLREAVLDNDPVAMPAWYRAQYNGNPIGRWLGDLTSRSTT